MLEAKQKLLRYTELAILRPPSVPLFEGKKGGGTGAHSPLKQGEVEGV